MAQGLELFANLDVVVDFAVVQQDPIARRGSFNNWAQTARGRVEDAEPGHRQLHAAGPVVSGLIRPAVLDRPDHALDSIRLDAHLSSFANDSRDGTHGSARYEE